MSHLKLSLIVVILFTCLGLSAQNIANQYFIYSTNPQDNVAVLNAANVLSSNVIEFSEPNQHLALLEWDGNPFVYGSINVNSMVQIMSITQGDSNEPKPIDIDGGTLNAPHNPIKGSGTIGSTDNCYPTNSSFNQAGNVTKVGIFDTGLNYIDAQNQGYEFKYVTEIGAEGVQDENGHGTHVGTIIDGIYHRYMPNDPLHYVIGSSFDQNGQSTLFNLISSIEDALHLGGIDIMNFSFSYPSSGSEEGDAFYLLLNSAIADDVLFVSAAGNDDYNLDNNTSSTPGVPGDNGIHTYFPAAFTLDNVLGVGSYICGSKGTKLKSYFSNFGTTSIDFAAPGESIIGLNENNEFVAMSGTSQATAMVTGAAAVLKSKFNHLKPEELKCVLINFGEDAYNLQSQFKYGKTLSIENFINEVEIICSEESGNGNMGGSSSNEILIKSIKLSPVPFVDILNIQYIANMNSDVTFQVYGINGQLVSSNKEQALKGNNDFTINFNNIAYNNQYILRIISNDRIETRKISRF